MTHSNKDNQEITPYKSFWKWFLIHENTFYESIKNNLNINDLFFDKISSKLDLIKKDISFQSGMYNNSIAELILSSDGNISNIVYIEEIIKVAPKLENWKFTALNPPLNIEDTHIEMDGYSFNKSNLYFHSIDHKIYPDEIDLVFVHEDLNDNNEHIIIRGTYIFLDNFIGELNLLTSIDNISFSTKEMINNKLIPIYKLKDFLIWREKEFIENYKGIRHNTKNDNYSGIQATYDNGLPAYAIINTDLINWDRKASHPWIFIMKIEYKGMKENGLPTPGDYTLLNDMEKELGNQLLDQQGYLNIGRETGDSLREIYFACIDFRKPSKVFYKFQQKNGDIFNVEFEIFKDKYWRIFDKYYFSKEL